MQLREAMNKRRCVRKFKNKSIRKSVILDIVESSLKAPCAGGIFSVRVILVDDKSKKKKIGEACLEQNFISDAPYLLIVCSEKKQMKRLYGKFSDSYLKQQAGAAVENILLRTADLNLASCWIGAFEEKAIKRILEVPLDVDVEAVLPIGYPGEKPQEKFRPELKFILKLNSYKKKI